MKKFALVLVVLVLGCSDDTTSEASSGSLECVAPYHVENVDRCDWACGVGTEPNYDTMTCVCRPGLQDVGYPDGAGRLLCGLPCNSTPTPEDCED